MMPVTGAIRPGLKYVWRPKDVELSKIHFIIRQLMSRKTSKLNKCRKKKKFLLMMPTLIQRGLD